MLKKYVIAIVAIALCLLLFKKIELLPWWSFVIPQFILGLALYISGWRINFFLTGFLTGFLTWIAVYYHYHNTHPHGILDQSIALHYILLCAGLIGGLLTGLSIHSGSKVLSRSHLNHL